MKLFKGGGYAGVVMTPDGEPATGAEVILVGAKGAVRFTRDRRTQPPAYGELTGIRTESDGIFFHPLTPDAHSIVVIGNEGYAQLRVEQLHQNPVVRLQAWARVEGRLNIGEKIGAKELVAIHQAYIPYTWQDRDYRSPLELYLSATTEADGSFVFERVPPILVKALYYHKVRKRKTGTIPEAQWTFLQLKPGENRKIQLGGAGRAVIGRVIVKGYDKEIVWRDDVHSITRILPEPPGVKSHKELFKAYRADLDRAKTPEHNLRVNKEHEALRKENNARKQAFFGTEAGRDHYLQNRRYALNFRSDGSFRIADVEGGKYRLSIDLREPVARGQRRFEAPRIASVEMEFEVPPTPPGQLGAPVELGVIELKAIQP